MTLLVFYDLVQASQHWFKVRHSRVIDKYRTVDSNAMLPTKTQSCSNPTLPWTAYTCHQTQPPPLCSHSVNECSTSLIQKHMFHHIMISTVAKNITVVAVYLHGNVIFRRQCACSVSVIVTFQSLHVLIAWQELLYIASANFWYLLMV